MRSIFRKCIVWKWKNPTTIQVVCTFRCQTNRTCWLSEKIISQPPEQGIPPFLKRRTLTDNIFIDAGWESNPWWPSTLLAWQTRRASLKCSWDKVPAAQGQLAFPERFLFHLYFWPQKYRNRDHKFKFRSFLLVFGLSSFSFYSLAENCISGNNGCWRIFSWVDISLPPGENYP